MVIIEELKEIHDPKDVHNYLEKNQLIIPPGEIISPSLLSTALQHVTKIKVYQNRQSMLSAQ
jgi:hypothetical protein